MSYSFYYNPGATNTPDTSREFPYFLQKVPSVQVLNTKKLIRLAS
jgi:hypothetical protein